MFKKLKRIYAQWLFDKYGFERGPLFEEIPVVYKLNPLWSPSVYGACEGEEIAKAFRRGVEEGAKNPIQINWDEVFEENRNNEQRNCDI